MKSFSVLFGPTPLVQSPRRPFSGDRRRWTGRRSHPVDIEAIGKSRQINLAIYDTRRTEFRETEVIIRLGRLRVPQFLERGSVKRAQNSAHRPDKRVLTQRKRRPKHSVA